MSVRTRRARFTYIPSFHFRLLTRTTRHSFLPFLPLSFPCLSFLCIAPRYKKERMAQHVYFFQKLGMSQSEIVLMFTRSPALFSLTLQKNIMAKV